MKTFKGIGASEGISVGKAVIIKEAKITYDREASADAETEKERFDKALAEFKQKTEAMAADMKERVGEKDSEILMGHIALATDPALSSEVIKQIDGGKCAEEAFETVCDTFIAMFSSIPDEMMRQRATDIGDVKQRILEIMTGNESVDIASLGPNTVLVADDLTPSMTAGINRENVLGILTQQGGKTSHSAILARALEIPAVLSVSGVIDELSDGDTVILDGSTGEVFVNPDEKLLEKYQKEREVYLSMVSELLKYKDMPTKSASGEEYMLFGNIGNPEEAAQVKARGGEGVGLFRTEFLFMGKSSLPTEQEQFEAYKSAVEAMKGGSVIIRTLDVGGDKDIPYLGLKKEENPFLGFRAVRYCLSREDIYKVQLKALLRASAYGDIKIMVPLVTSIDELRQVRALVAKLKAELDEAGIPYNKDIEIGVMMETPAASVIADILAKEADFFSIGTNDLTQYTMAVDRGNADVAYLYSTYNPAVLRSIKRIIECANAEGIVCGMCGEAAADPKLIPLLMSFGLKEFSVTASSVLKTRKTISQWSKAETDELQCKAMELATEAEISELLAKSAK